MRVEHIGIAVKDLDAVVTQYQRLFPKIKIVPEPVADGSMKMVIVHFDNIKIELMEPLKEDSPVGKFIAKNGEGIHHLAFSTDDIEASLDCAKENNIRVVTEKPYIGAEGFLVAFLHPKDTHGVLTEFCQEQPINMTHRYIYKFYK
jgi:methylmalonyl-CoA/ethylmalonyl-CoA epimerase